MGKSRHHTNPNCVQRLCGIRLIEDGPTEANTYTKILEGPPKGGSISHKLALQGTTLYIHLDHLGGTEVGVKLEVVDKRNGYTGVRIDGSESISEKIARADKDIKEEPEVVRH